MKLMRFVRARGSYAPGAGSGGRSIWGRGLLVVAILMVGAAVSACGPPGPTEIGGTTGEWFRADPGGITGTPYVDDELVVYATVEQARIVAVERSTGNRRWERALPIPTEFGRFSTNLEIRRHEDLLLVSGWDLYALDRTTGALRFVARPADDYGSVGRTALGRGRIYTTARRLYAFEAATGTLIWENDLDGEQPFGPVLAGDTLYVGTRRPLDATGGAGLGAGHVFALRATDGAELWRQPLPNAPDAPWLGGATMPGAVVDDLFVLSSPNARLYAFDRHSGELRWTYVGHMPFAGGVAVVDSVAVVANERIEGVGLRTGQRLWSKLVGSTVDNRLMSTPRVVLASAGRIYALDSQGQERWGFGGAAWNQPVFMTPAVAFDGTVYVGSPDGMHAVRLPEGLQ